MSEISENFNIDQFDEMVVDLMKNDEMFRGMVSSYLSGKSVDQISDEILTEEDKEIISKNDVKNLTKEKIIEEIDMMELKQMTQQASDYIIDKKLVENSDLSLIDGR